MGKKQEKKTAKGRLDKFYWMAKEQGYRSRAAFKLVQLNKKYNFLEKARCVIDLCAAPGGWCQVAAKAMPPNSLIVGVDLVPIKPIPHVMTFAEDINSFRCRDMLRAELKDWKADVVLHDGAPNVGTAWVQDAYSQNELVLQACKLAVEFLAPGGYYVTKVFRSKDYNNLMWVFNQLFRKVEATKPPSSRNVSAEIFVVCQDFKAPARIDPRLLDPKHVFKDLEPSNFKAAAGDEEGEDGKKPMMLSVHANANVFEPEKKRRKREGYEDGEMILFKSVSANDFIQGTDAVGMLGTFNEISFSGSEHKELLRNPLTTEEIKACCQDLRVLGRKDFRNLIRWRKEIREELGLEKPKGADLEDNVDGEGEGGKEKVEIDEMDEDEMVEEELARLKEEREKKLRKERRRKNESRNKRVIKMQLHMTTPMDIGMDLEDHELHGSGDFFDLKSGPGKNADEDDDAEEGEDLDEREVAHRRRMQALQADDEDEDEALDSDEERERKMKRLEGEVEGMYEQYKSRLSEKDAKFRAQESRLKNKARDEEFRGFGVAKADSDEEDGEGEEGNSDDEAGGYHLFEGRKMAEETYDTDDEEDDADEAEDLAIARIMAKRRRGEQEARAAREDMSAEDGEALPGADGKKRKRGDEVKSLITDLESKVEKKERQSREAAIWFDNPLFKGVAELGADVDDDEDEEEEDGEEEEEDDEDGEEEESEEDDDEPAEADDDDDDDTQWQYEDEDVDAAKQKLIEEKGLTTAEAITLASQLVNRERTKSDLIDSGFTKHNFVDKSDLPDWFLEDEGKHYKVNTPITKEAVEALRAKQRALDARPIKKIAEAKGRKKLKQMQRLEKLRLKADSLNESEDITEREKAKGIAGIMAKAGASAPRRKMPTLVVARGANRGLQGRPKGVKGRYKIVDPRQKKEIRSAKRIEKRDKGKRAKASGPSKNKRKVPNGY